MEYLTQIIHPDGRKQAAFPFKRTVQYAIRKVQEHHDV
jgi:hypothetical protein